MTAANCLYRRTSGIYVVRIAVPKRLREQLKKTEVHVSTQSRDLVNAKLAALQIEYQWRNRFMELDLQRLAVQSPLLAGDGIIPITQAAKLIGLSLELFLNELSVESPSLYTLPDRWPGLLVQDVDAIERDFDGSYLINSVERLGIDTVQIEICSALPDDNVLRQIISHGSATPSCFATKSGQLFWPTSDITIQPAAWYVNKSVVESIRVRLYDPIKNLKYEPTTATVLPPTPLEYLPKSDLRGQKRFSEVFDAYKNHRDWGKAQAMRMETEARIFIDVMKDPEIGVIEIETIHQYANRLAALPTNIYHARRKYGKDASMDDLIQIAARENLQKKADKTISGHISRLAEILNFAVSPGNYIRSNPASGFRTGWSANKSIRAQDQRAPFNSDDLTRIFSESWFAEGAGEFSSSGLTNWRPHQYWLPLLAIFSGGRLNELSQLYLKDIRQSETHPEVWSIDFNLEGNGKKDIDESDGNDKSMKTVNAIRIVPIHPQLLKLGLPQYVTALRKAGYARLFPELKRDNIKGYGKPAGSWFNERFLGKKLGMERNGQKTFHSFRHNFATALERLDLSERVVAQLMGHQRGNSEGMSRYAKDREAAELVGQISRLNFPEVESVAVFKVDAALRAIDCALRRKKKIAATDVLNVI